MKVLAVVPSLTEMSVIDLGTFEIIVVYHPMSMRQLKINPEYWSII